MDVWLKGSSCSTDPPHHDGVTGLGVLEELLHPRPGDRGPAARRDVGKDVTLMHT